MPKRPAHVYSVDTSCLINGWRFNYPPKSFPGLWKNVDELIARGGIVASEEVLYELKKKDDELFDWAKARPGMFVPHDFNIQQAVSAILKKHRGLVRQRKNPSGADPFVIAVAMTRNCVVVSEEGPSRNPTVKPKIPDVCRDLKVLCIRTVELISQQGWEF
jgi:hypothetical protein